MVLYRHESPSMQNPPQKGGHGLPLRFTSLSIALVSLALSCVLVVACQSFFKTRTIDFSFRVADKNIAPLLDRTYALYATKADPAYSNRQRVNADVDPGLPDGFFHLVLPNEATSFRLDVVFDDRPDAFPPRDELALEIDVSGKRRELRLPFVQGKPFYARSVLEADDFVSVDFNAKACMSVFCLAAILLALLLSTLLRAAPSLGTAWFVCGFVAVCVLPALDLNQDEASARENRNLDKFPSARVLRAEGVSAWCRQFESAFADRFFGRYQLMDVHSAIASVFDDRGNAKVHVGGDGWLFFEETLQDFANTQPMHDRKTVEKIRKYLDSINDYAKRRGKKFVFFIAPDKCRIYPEHVRFHNKVRPDSESRTEQLVAYLREHCDFPVVYPRGELAAMKETFPFPFYYKGDTHWNHAGAYFGGYLPVMEAFGFPDVRVVRIDDWREPRFWGGLSDMLGRKPYRADLDAQTPRWANGTYVAPRPGYNPGKKVAFESDRHQKGRIDGTIVTRNPVDGNHSLYCLHDSFYTDLVPLFSDSFARTSSRHVLRGIRAEDKPQIDESDAILLEIVERNVLRLAKFSLPAPFREEVP